MLNPLEHPVCLQFPLLLEETAWAEHIPFAMFIVSAMKPKVIVELGTWKGVSYCAFCQAVKELRLNTRCYAIDTWKGDAHAGSLIEEDFLKLKQHHDPLYSSFSTLIQSTFDEAVKHFADREIDLLHIDGLHTYEAVKHDFMTWLPKMSSNGVILLHDTNERQRDFGVHALWREISQKYPHFEFLHGHGLGVVAVGTEIPAALKDFFNSTEEEATLIRSFFQTLGLRIDAVRKKQELEHLFVEQERYIKELMTYEATVKKSILMRIYRTLRFEGIGSLIKNLCRKIH
ncbi:MAG: class I SAM-dependent methyltransferase [Pyrinomonadaceae bacterium]|nr:class I SAM-dependent methyltransferase [Pyrinomonadaceae bacterium]MCX7639838.1 class I SAM-dependent methyltransferase [Pyrinomonadaceae bacterium]MDW8304010.1 class I SAM-dependent methyltransferase [Acidobacteriota bacterium]